MRIKLTLLRTAADPADLAVTVDGTATVADLARTLAETDPVPTYYSQDELRDLTLRVHGTPGTDDRSTRTPVGPSRTPLAERLVAIREKIAP